MVTLGPASIVVIPTILMVTIESLERNMPN